MEFHLVRLEFVVETLLAVLLGGIIGVEREMRDKPAGLRTHILICLGATLFTDLAQNMVAVGGDPGRLAGHVAAGVGFIGAGTILHQRGEVTGLTTAANVWVVAAIGMALGFNAYRDAIAVTLLVVVVLAGLGRAERFLARRARTGRIEVQAGGDAGAVEELRALVARSGLETERFQVRRQEGGFRLELRLHGPEARHARLLSDLARHPAVSGVSTAD